MFRRFSVAAVVAGGLLSATTGCADGMAGGLLDGGLAGALMPDAGDDAARAAEPAPAPPAPAPIVLLQQTLGIAQVGLPGGAVLQFTPIATGRAVTLHITGDVTASRPTIEVFDPAFNVVVNEDNPVTSSTIGTFVPGTVGTHIVFFKERGLPASTYSITITQE